MRTTIAILTFCFLVACTATKTKQEIDTLLRSNGSPGAMKDAVEQFLVDQQIEYSYVERERAIHAIVRDVTTNVAVRQSIVIRFDFDDRERLIKYEVAEKHTGP